MNSDSMFPYVDRDAINSQTESNGQRLRPMNFRNDVAPYLAPETLEKLASQGSCFHCKTVPFNNPFENFSGFADWSRDMALMFQKEEAETAAETIKNSRTEPVKINESYRTGKHAIISEPVFNVAVGADAQKTIREMKEYFEQFAQRLRTNLFPSGTPSEHIAKSFQLLGRRIETDGIRRYKNKVLACADDSFTIVDKKLCPQEKSSN